jgi:hypothetical protein
MSFLRKSSSELEMLKLLFVRDKHGTITTSINDSLSSLLEHHFPHGSNSAGIPLPVVTDLLSVSFSHYDWLSVDRIESGRLLALSLIMRPPVLTISSLSFSKIFHTLLCPICQRFSLLLFF